jgi:hypothetical protein
VIHARITSPKNQTARWQRLADIKVQVGEFELTVAELFEQVLARTESAVDRAELIRGAESVAALGQPDREKFIRDLLGRKAKVRAVKN